jgi:type IX secretion system PorP/SprF family membrane protein
MYFNLGNVKQFVQNILFFAGSAFAFSACFAQDVHFSHMEFSPLTLNPALAGANSPMQGIVNYRSQWNSVATPYQTIAASFDARFNENKRNRSGIIAGGINFYNDQAGDLKVNTSSASLNLAYHLILDRTSTIGIALNSGFGQRSINADGGRWGSQYNGLNYDASINPSEVLNNSSFNYFDAGAGVLYSYGSGGGYMNQNINRKLNAGFAVYHINRPNYSYYETENERLHMRISGFVNAEIGIANTRGSILPGIYYQRQKTAQEVYFGANYKYNLHEGSRHTGFTRPIALYIGIFARYRDALVGKVMFEYDQFSAGFGYDINVSSLSPVSRTRGGFELFLRFNAGDGGGFRSRI